MARVILPNVDSGERVEFVQGEQRRFLIAIKRAHGLSEQRFAGMLSVKRRTLRNWLCENRLLPFAAVKKLASLFPEESGLALECVLSIKEADWGRVIGGKTAYSHMIAKYGYGEVKRRRIKGTLNCVANKTKKLNVDLNLEILELYGALIGDGCLSAYKQDGRLRKVVRIDGSTNDEIYYRSFLVPLIYRNFQKKARMRKRRDCNGIYLSLYSAQVFDYFKNELSFPVGRKGAGLALPEKILLLPEEGRCAVLRGVADTDGALFFVNSRYPQIRLTSKSEAIICQLGCMLSEMGFKFCKRKDAVTGVSSLTISGSKQLERWMTRIGFNNLSQLSRYLYWRKFSNCPANKVLQLENRLKRLGLGAFPTSIQLGPYLFWQNLAR